MDKTDTSRKPSYRGASHECCTDAPCDSGLRNQYFEGKRLTADSFRVEQSYLVERRRLLNRAIHGWGVVYGYALKPAPPNDRYTKDNSGRLEIGPGLALDECGRELLRTRTTMLAFDEVTLFDGKGARLQRPPDGSFETLAEQKRTDQKASAQKDSGQKPEEDRPGSCWLLSAHYAEQAVGPVKVSDPCSCERHEWDHVCETVRFSLRHVECAECCKPFDCEMTCGCGTGPCCDEHVTEQSNQSGAQFESTEQPKRPSNPVNRGGCQCLCEQLTSLSQVECGLLCEIEDPCAHIRADLCHAVPLACVRLREGECDGEWLFDRWIEACGPRRLVKRSDALFDLIRGCDLTRISAIGWAGWHRSQKPIEWEDFEASFGKEDEGEREGDPGRRSKTKSKRKKVPIATATYWVEFSRTVRKHTVRADCFSMTVFVEEREGGWDEAYHVPILDVSTSAPPGTPAGLVTRATLVVDAGWLGDAVKGNKTIFDEDPTTVEIEIRGDLIVDCNGQTVDANAHGLSPAPTGSGTPGGTFFSSFHVQPRYAEYRVEDKSTDRTETEGVQS